MAVGSKKSRSKARHRRGGNTKVCAVQIGLDPVTGETIQWHTVSESGTYRGKKVFKEKE